MPVGFQLPNIAGSFIAGREARQQYEAGQQKNALNALELEQDPREIANRNALNDQRTQQYTDQQQQQALTQAKATAEHISQRPDAKAFAQGQFPAFVQMAEQRLGARWDDLTDNDVQNFASDFAQQSAAKLGQGPAARPVQLETIEGPGGSVLQKDPTTNALKQVVAPQRADHFAEAEAGRNKRSTQTQPVTESNVDAAAQAIANYQQPPLSAFTMAKPFGQAVLAKVMELNPDYQANEYGSRNKAYKDFASGKNGNQVRSFNVAISHLDSLQSMVDALDNGDTPLFNKLKNEFARQTGKAAANTFDGMKKIVTDEIVKSIVGGATGVADREEAAATIATANSPAQLVGVVEGYKTLMAGQLGGLRQQYEQSTGRKDFERLLSGKAIEYLRKHGDEGGAPSAAPAQAGGQPVRVNTPQEALALPPGTVFITPDGRQKVR